MKNKQEIIDGWRGLTHRQWKGHGISDHRVEGRNRAFADMFELFYEKVEEIWVPEDPEESIRAFEALLESQTIVASTKEDYRKGYNEALEVGRDLFRQYVRG